MAEALVLRFRADGPNEARDLAAAALLDFDTTAIHELTDDEWRVFLRNPAERERAIEALAPWCDVSTLAIADEDWARRSQENLKAITVGRLVIAPPWDVPDATASERAGTRVIVIEPSMGFGTAHHATTRLCLRALQQCELGGRRVLDVGTGSGVLAIAAAVLGADRVVAIDYDPDALDAARENVRRNGVRVELRQENLQRDALEPADVVVANLTGALLQRSAGRLADLARGGTLIVTGLLDEEASDVRAAFAPYGASAEEERESGWTAFVFTVPV